MSTQFTDPIWKSVDLPVVRKTVLVKVGDNANDAGFSWPSVGRIAHETGISVRTVQRVLKEFVDAGFLEIRANLAGGKGRSRVYWINLERVTACHPLAEFEGFLNKRQCPVGVKTGHFATPPGTSVPGGEADIFPRRSVVGGRADVPETWPRSPLLARRRHCSHN